MAVEQISFCKFNLPHKFGTFTGEKKSEPCLPYFRAKTQARVTVIFRQGDERKCEI